MNKQLLERQRHKIFDNAMATLTDENDPLIKQTISFAIRYMIEAVYVKNSEIAIQYFRWMLDHLVHKGYGSTLVKTSFETIKHELHTLIGDNITTEINFETITNAPSSLNHFDKESDSAYKPYLNALFNRDKNEAYNIVHTLIKQEMTVSDIYSKIIQPSMYEIGYLWQTGKINIADEHLATVISQYVMTTLYPIIFSTPKHPIKAVGTAIGKERHEIGIRMIMDMFEYHGYQTQYLGANTPQESFIAFARDFAPDIIALSLTLSIHFSELKSTIDAIRNDPLLSHVKIIIGGQPFSTNPELIEMAGADGYAATIDEALKEGDRLVEY